MQIYHNSQDELYRFPFGAVPTESFVNIKLRVASENKPNYVKIRLWIDGKEFIYDMSCTKPQLYSIKLQMPGEPTLVWYYFITKIGNEILYYSNNEKSLGGEGIMTPFPTSNSYQITVFRKGFKTPDWFKNGIVYQIFPDRFYSSHNDVYLYKKRDEYIIHEDWYELLSFNNHPYENGPACNDFYGGNLKGIIEKLPYLKYLGISIIYLNPIFDAYSNHKYDTADYKNIDPMFGDNEIFKKLCENAKGLGIRIILDGVFSHTGSDSLYFNKYGNYGESTGAYKNRNSPYREWYSFKGDTNEYECWWGSSILPNVKEMTSSYLNFILRDEDAVVKRWIKYGASGWRLDVADELPDKFIEILRHEVKKAGSDAVVIGEVWEDASNKVSYGQKRRYLLGDGLDGVMNYPFKDSMISFILGNIKGSEFGKQIMHIIENYPFQALYCAMNVLGTHDTMRIKSVLGEISVSPDATVWEKQGVKLSPRQETLALERLRLIVFIQMTFVGVPSIYYGDEIGMQGLADPFNRMPYNWRCIDAELNEYYANLCRFRNENPCLRTGKFMPLYFSQDVYVYARYIRDNADVFGNKTENSVIVCAVNRGNNSDDVSLDLLEFNIEKLYKGFDKSESVVLENGKLDFSLKPMSTDIFMT